MSMIGRELVRRGEILFSISVEGGEVKFYPVSSHDIDGEYQPDSWRYRLHFAGPSGSTSIENVPSSAVLHFMYAVEPATPYVGRSPLEVAALTGRLSAELVKALADEASGPRGSFLPLPVDGADASIEFLKNDVKKLKGSIAFVESSSDSWGGSATGPRKDWEVSRIGANPPSSLVDLAALASQEVMAACGISPAIFSADAAGTGSREAWRFTLFSCLKPIGDLVAAELSEKLETPVEITWDELRASDITGRSRAVSTLVTAGVNLDKAMALAGLSSTD